MTDRRGRPQEYIDRLKRELELTDQWRKHAESDEQKEELDKEWMFFSKLLETAERLAKRHGEWRH